MRSGCFSRWLLSVTVAIAAPAAITACAAPGNDYFTNSVHLEGTNVTGTANLTGATREPGEPDHRKYSSYSMTGESAWWSWAAPATGRATLSGLGFIFDVQVAVYTGSSVDQLKRVYLNQYMAFAVQAGTIYHIAVERRTDGNPAVNFSLSYAPFFVDSPNDHFTNAAPVGTLAGLVGATREPGEPAHRAGGPNKSLWWKFTASANGQYWVTDNSGVLPDVTVAIYTGEALQTLTLVARTMATNNFYFTGNGGTTYYVAAETAAEVQGDVGISAGGGMSDRRIVAVPGNIVVNPSFETLDLDGRPLAGWTGDVTGYISGATGNEYAADGGNCVGFGWGSEISQTLNTVPGQVYRVKLAIDYQGNTARVVVRFGDQVSPEYVIPALSGEWYWHWATFTFTANTNATLLAVRSLESPARIDDVTCVPLNQPPVIRQQPAGRSVYPGGSATFVVGVTGSEPLFKQWLFNGQPLDGQQGTILNVTNVTSTNIGIYQFTATNQYGWATSAPVSLVLAEATSPAIVMQPLDYAAQPGEFVSLVVAAIGTPPLGYQWYKDGQPLSSETNRHLVFMEFNSANVGTYSVVVSSCLETVTSLPAQLTLADPVAGGGTVYFANRQFILEAPADAPVFDVDGSTRLSGPEYAVRLYAGPAPDTLRPISAPKPFESGFGAGFFSTTVLTLPDVCPGVPLFAQLRAWDASQGASYEEVQALGGRLGVSPMLTIVTAGGISPAPTDGFLLGLQSFSLRSGLPEYRRGRLQLLDKLPSRALVWELVGEPGGRYLIEHRLDDANWTPLLTVTNLSGRITFTNTPPPGSKNDLFRAQLLQ